MGCNVFSYFAPLDRGNIKDILVFCSLGVFSRLTGVVLKNSRKVTCKLRTYCQYYVTHSMSVCLHEAIKKELKLWSPSLVDMMTLRVGVILGP